MIKLIIKKEILQEIKSKESILSMVVFGITIILILGFTIHPNKVDLYNIIPGIFWLTYLFTTIIGLLRLFNSEYELVDFVEYDDSAPWPTQPDGNGPTLELIDPINDNSIAENWTFSNGNGSPAQSNN